MLCRLLGLSCLHPSARLPPALTTPPLLRVPALRTSTALLCARPAGSFSTFIRLPSRRPVLPRPLTTTPHPYDLSALPSIYPAITSPSSHRARPATPTPSLSDPSRRLTHTHSHFTTRCTLRYHALAQDNPQEDAARRVENSGSKRREGLSSPSCIQTEGLFPAKGIHLG